ncbi:glycosylphosphatidylinositol anchor biosynthesis [Orbilia brochopaga]|uniref:Mannosyltransferase n=1 Tax=Orbilia brochopaga TaxID=3140254 RepID=A0AAV9U227_9PEZI
MPSFFASSTATIFLVVFGIRLLNSLTLSTFFQPDEYFQSLEVAASWRQNSPGYVTWEWHHALRSVLYPRIFHGTYFLVDALAQAFKLSSLTHAELLVVAPKIAGAFIAAVGDVYTGRLAQKLWGDEAGNYALLLSLCSAWNWFCSARTFSNCLETTLTVVGMTYWPWRNFRMRDLTLASVFAALSFTVRPTNGLISWAIGPLLLDRLPKFPDRVKAVFQIGFVSAIVLILNAAIDYTFYHRITFPFIEFYRLNVTQSISEFYGVSPWHYYYSQGLPLLLTGYLPLALFSLYKGLLSSSTSVRQLVVLANLVPVAFMATRHKEVRFLYPLLPIFHVLMAGVGLPALPKNWKSGRVIVAMVMINLPIAYYTSYIHQRGVVDVVNWLRVEHYSGINPPPQQGRDATRVGFLMPCHSTPFGSYLWEAAMRNSTNGVKMSAWFLTCEPPISLSLEERKTYLDEADQFYANSTVWLMEKFGPPPTQRQETVADSESLWPDKLVTFEATAELVKEHLMVDQPMGRYRECQRFFNSHWHDDWRRKGDVIVWCLI